MKTEMKTLGLILMLTAVTPQTTIAEPMLEIFTPTEHSTVRSEVIHLVGKSSSSFVEVFLNGVSIGSVEVKDSIFHKLIEFGYGINDITVVTKEPSEKEGYLARLRKVEALYSPSKVNRFVKVYEELEFHGTNIEKQCVECHDLDFQNEGIEQTQKSCVECHTTVAKSIKRHAGAESETCVTCHISDGSMNSLVSRDDNLCFSCHPERIGLFSKEHIHGPVAAGSCLCHNPHGSDYEKSLVRPVQLLCFSCHTEIENQLEERVIHNPFERGNCVACHDPHASSNKWALVKTSQELCLSCHAPGDDFDHSHPYNVRPKSKLNVPLKLTPRGQLECLSCHSPHASSAEHLLRITSEFTCIGCHTEKM